MALSVNMLLLLLLPLVCSAYNYDDQQLTDPDLVGDIFGTQQEQVEEPGRSAPIIQETRCDEIRPCVECSVFKQYWKHFSSAYECYESCKQFSFVTQPGLNISTLISSSLCTWFSQRLTPSALSSTPLCVALMTSSTATPVLPRMVMVLECLVRRSALAVAKV